MSFDTNQPNYQALRLLLSEQAKQVAIFCGAGLSYSAGMPSWRLLKEKLVDSAKRHIAPRDEKDKRGPEALIVAAENELIFWESFELLKKAMGESTYIGEMQKFFSAAP